MPERSEFTNMALSFTDKATAMIEKLRGDPALRDIPFMEEKMSPQDMRRRIERMTPLMRRAFVEKKGIQAVMKMMGGGR